MTKADLVEEISAQTGVSKNHTAIIVDDMLDAVCRALSEGQASRDPRLRHVQGARAPRPPGAQPAQRHGSDGARQARAGVQAQQGAEGAGRLGAVEAPEPVAT